MTDPTPVADLVAALAALEDPQKTGKVEAGQRNYKFMTLPDLLKAVRETLGLHHIAVMQHVVKTDAGVSVTTTLLHASGHTWITDPLELPSQRDPQSVGSIITYGRRYQLAALVGLTGSDDDDAEPATPKKVEPDTTVRVASKRPAPPAALRPGKPAQTAQAGRGPTLLPVTGEQLTHMHTLISTLEKQSGERMDPDTRRTMIGNLLHLDNLASAKDLTRAQASEAIDILTALTREEEPPDGQPEVANET